MKENSSLVTLDLAFVKTVPSDRAEGMGLELSVWGGFPWGEATYSYKHMSLLPFVPPLKSPVPVLPSMVHAPFQEHP